MLRLGPGRWGLERAGIATVTRVRLRFASMRASPGCGVEPTLCSLASGARAATVRRATAGRPHRAVESDAAFRDRWPQFGRGRGLDAFGPGSFKERRRCQRPPGAVSCFEVGSEVEDGGKRFGACPRGRAPPWPPEQRNAVVRSARGPWKDVAVGEGREVLFCGRGRTLSALHAPFEAACRCRLRAAHLALCSARRDAVQRSSKGVNSPASFNTEKRRWERLSKQSRPSCGVEWRPSQAFRERSRTR